MAVRAFTPSLVVAALAALWTWAMQNVPFFWDTVQLASKHAHFFYENDLKWAVLPPAIDSGHPPLLGYYLACIWAAFGKTLVVSHWAMFPFLAGIGLQMLRLGRVLHPRWGYFLLPLLCLDPVFMGQASLISPDMVVVLGLLLVINGTVLHHRWSVVLGGLLLCTFSMRGMMCAAALGLWQLILCSGPWRTRWRAVLPLLPGALLGLAFLVWHHRAAGWTGHFEGSSWASAFERVDARGLVRNVAILAWRWLDMDRFLVWGSLLLILFSTGGRTFWATHRIWVLLLLCLLLFLTPSALLYKNLSAHRYFLPIFVALGILVLHGIAAQNWPKKAFLLVFLCVGMALGNFWVYPKGVSMDWDSTLSHLPYHSLRENVIQYIDHQNIDWNTVGTTFPNLNTNEDLLLNGDRRIMRPLDFEQNQWIVASNVLNDIDEPEYAILQRDWILVRRWGGWPVWFELWSGRG